jgi:Zn-dependent peptidase ImmA (M78 family)/transcriptional regulator with XRE-family HTH domain
MDLLEAERAAAAFDPAQLVTARELKGYSQVELARAAGGISAASLSQFEKAHARPSAQTLARLAEALEVPERFLARRPREAETPDAFFRSLRSTAVSDRRRARGLTKLVYGLVRELEQYVTLPALGIPEIRSGTADAEDAAQRVREEWGVPAGPVRDVVDLLETHGVVTARFRVQASKVDAFSMPFSDRPIVVLGADKGHRDRSRFDAAHELGHLVLHRRVQPGETAWEREAHRFAAAFLMPADDIAPLLPTRPDWRRLLELKATWHVSLAALLMRAKTLGVMSDTAYLSGIKAMSAKGWRKDEPGDLGAPESPRLLSAAIRTASESGTTLQEIAARGGLPLQQLNGILGPSINPRPAVRL